MPKKHASSSDDDDDFDPGREVVEKNQRDRLKRIADHTRDELNRVLQRVEYTLNAYDNSVQSSLVQHGMTHEQLANVEHVADLKELEELLNDTIAKKRYKQRLMVFIVGQTEQIKEKEQLLHQIEQFFIEQKQNFSGKEFNDFDERPDQTDEVDLQLKSFDIKDCYSHVRSLGIRLTELNEEIVTHLIQTAATKFQTKGKKKGNQLSKEVKDQLSNLQSRLEAANTDVVAKTNRIDELEREISHLKEALQTYQDEREKLQENLKNCFNQIEDSKERNFKLEESKEQLQNEIDDLRKLNETRTKPVVFDVSIQCEVEEQSIVSEKNDQRKNSSSLLANNMTVHQPLDLTQSMEPDVNLNLIFHPTDGIDLHDVTAENLPTAYENLRRFAIIRVRELLKELELNELQSNDKLGYLKQEFDSYKIMADKERQSLAELAENAYKLQMKAQTTAEEAMNHLKIYMAEHDSSTKPMIIDEETQTDPADNFENQTEANSTVMPDATDPNDERMQDVVSPRSKVFSDDAEINGSSRNTSIKQKYIDLLEEKQQELDNLKHLAEMVLSRPHTSAEEKTTPQDFDSLTVAESMIRHDQEQQTSFHSSPKNSVPNETNPSVNFISRLVFSQLYEIIYKFRSSVANLLAQNQFQVFSDRLLSLQPLDSDVCYQPEQIVQSAETLLKEMAKVLQTTMSMYSSRINEYEIRQRDFANPPKINEEPTSSNPDQSAFLEEKEMMITDLTMKYKKVTEMLNESMKEHEEETKQNQSLILEQQKYNEKLQQELARLQKHANMLEHEGVIEPSILFTRLDIERNEQSLRKAIDQGKMSDTKYEKLKEAMKEYLTLPSQQFRNLVERYMHHRRALELSAKQSQSSISKEKTRELLGKMEDLHEKRSEQIRERIFIVRQQRVDLAKKLTETFDDLENENGLLLIRPIYSCQGRTAVRKYMKLASERHRKILQARQNNKPHHPSRLSAGQKSENTETTDNALDTEKPSDTYEDAGLFHINESFVSSLNQPISIHLTDLNHIEELEIQRALMPIAHTNTSLLTTFTINGIDPYIPSLNLRSYVALSRPGVRQNHRGKSSELITPISRDSRSRSGVSGRSHMMHPRTPLNSSIADTRYSSPTLPPIKRTFIPTCIDEKSQTNLSNEAN